MSLNAETSTRALSTDEIEAVEKFIVDTQFRIFQLMRLRKVSRKQLADALGVSKARITQLFGDNGNITMETLARIFFALDEKCEVTSRGVEHALHQIDREIDLESIPASQVKGREWRRTQGTLSTRDQGDKAAQCATVHKFATIVARSKGSERWAKASSDRYGDKTGGGTDIGAVRAKEPEAA